MWIMSQLFFTVSLSVPFITMVSDKIPFPRQTWKTTADKVLGRIACEVVAVHSTAHWNEFPAFYVPSFYTTNYFTSNYCITSCYDKLLSLNAAQAISLECSEEYEFAPFWYSLKGNPTINESNHDQGKKGKSSNILSLSAGYETRLTNVTFILRQHAISFCLRPSPI